MVMYLAGTIKYRKVHSFRAPWHRAVAGYLPKVPLTKPSTMNERYLDPLSRIGMISF